MPAYRAAEAAAILALPASTVKAWAFGQNYVSREGASKRFLPLIAAADLPGKLLSFSNLCELHVLSAIRRVHRIDMKAVRHSLTYVANKMAVSRPLIALDFSTNGIDLFVEEIGKSQTINVSKNGQFGLRGGLEIGLKRIERDVRGAPVRLFPFSRISQDTNQPRQVALDPAIAFGRPILVGAGVPTRIIRDRFDAGDSLTEMAKDFRVSVAEMEEAMRFELRKVA
jgi:uncharacterized protein (DUF433 family)